MHEFTLIEKYFSPLAAEAGLGLKDDAAFFTPPPGCSLVMTQDAMTAGIHFFPDDPADLIARKLLRVNLSDLAAKGAKPIGYLMSLLLPNDTEDTWVADFARGLAEDQHEFGIKLFGGDTSCIQGPLTLSLTAIGGVPAEKMIRRSGAKPGDAVYVTGTLGDAALGLRIRRGELPANEFLENRYLLPQPRSLPNVPVSACLDISDGFAQDAEHLADASGVRLVIEYDRLPVSDAARAMLSQIPNSEAVILAGGDDYELLFTASPHEVKGEYARIGHVETGTGVSILDASGQSIALKQKGWRHF